MPSGTYSALLFRFGASSDVGFGELPTQDDYDNMEWPAEMGGGYHYMRLEGLFGDDQPLLSHTGPAGGADYSFVVELPLTLDVDGDDLEVHVVMDVNEWFADPVTYDFAGVGMMMGNTDAQLTHQSNGATVFGLGHIGPAREGSMAADDDMNGMDDEQADDDGHDHDH